MLGENGSIYGHGRNSLFKIHVGPMGARKTTEMLIDAFEIEESDVVVRAVKSIKDPRPPEDFIVSRIPGLQRAAFPVLELSDIEPALEAAGQSFADVQLIVADELMFFDNVDKTRESIEYFLSLGKAVLASSLDIAGNGKPFPVIDSILELKPDLMSHEKPCANCRHPKGRHTGIYSSNDPGALPFKTDGLPFYVPDNGLLGYRALCRNCYHSETTREDAVDFTEAIAQQLKLPAEVVGRLTL